MNRVRWGILGTGNIANKFAQDIAHVGNAFITAVTSRRLEVASEFANKHGIENIHEGEDSLLADPNVDAIYIATPHSLHLQNAINGLNSGKHVLCEKPITTSAADCHSLIEVAQQNERYLMEAMWTWFLPAVKTAQAWVNAGRIGELRRIKAEFGYPVPFDPKSRLYDPALAGGCLLDMGIYPIAIARLFSGQPPEKVHVLSRHASTGVDDDVAMLFDYSDCIAELAASFRCKLPNMAYIVGTRGYIVIPDFWQANECRLVIDDEEVDQFVDSRKGGGFEFQIEAVSNDILDEKLESSVVTHAASIGFQEDMDRVKEQFCSI